MCCLCFSFLEMCFPSTGLKHEMFEISQDPEILRQILFWKCWNEVFPKQNASSALLSSTAAQWDWSIVSFVSSWGAPSIGDLWTAVLHGAPWSYGTWDFQPPTLDFAAWSRKPLPTMPPTGTCKASRLCTAESSGCARGLQACGSTAEGLVTLALLPRALFQGRLLAFPDPLALVKKIVKPVMWMKHFGLS